MPPTPSISVGQYRSLVEKHYNQLIKFAQRHADRTRDDAIDAKQLVDGITAERNQSLANLDNASIAPANAPLPAVGSPGASSHPTPLPGAKLDHSTADVPPVAPIVATAGTGTTVLTQEPQTVAPEVPAGDAASRAPLSVAATQQAQVNDTTSPVKTDPDKEVDEVKKAPEDEKPSEEQAKQD